MDNGLDLFTFLNGIRLELDSDNSCWIQKIPNFATVYINICFFHTPNIA